jgi:hypothetical protein
MSYSWIGPPTEFNATDTTTGGDSGKSTSYAHVPSATPGFGATLHQIHCPRP